MPSAAEQAITALRDLGLNQLEAEVYSFLLANEPKTAYAVGRAISRPTANVYKAVESLSQRGAVVVEEGGSRVCRAIPAREFLRHSEKSFLSRTREAATALASLQSDFSDERVYRVEHVDEVFERCAAMLERAHRVIVIDAFPQSLERLVPAIRSAIKRSVDVWIEAYRPITIDGAAVVIAQPGESSIELWRAEQLNVVVDGKEVLLALMSLELETVYQALWSRSLYLACLMHGGMMSEHTVHRIHQADREGRDPLRALREHKFFVDSEVPGQKELRDRFVDAPPQNPGRKKRNLH